MQRRWYYLVALAAAAGGVAAVLLWPAPGSRPSLTESPPASVTAVPADDLLLHGEESGELSNIKAATILLTGLPAAFAQGRTDGLAVEAGATGIDVHTAFPEGASISVDSVTWRRTGTVASVMVAVATRDQSTRHMVILFRDDNEWKLSETYPADDR